MDKVVTTVANKTKINLKQITAVLSLIKEGATIPFIARYRKEATNNLDEEQIREIVVIYEYEEKLAKRKEEVKRLIEEKDKLTPELVALIEDSSTLSEVEDIYLPFKEKRKTRATTAIKNGLEPLANTILECKNIDLDKEALNYLNENVLDIEAALQGARDIIAEMYSENHEIRQKLRTMINDLGVIETTLKKDAIDERKTYELYYDRSEPINKIVPHRILAINRAEKENILRVKISIDNEAFIDYSFNKLVKDKDTVEAKQILEAIEDGYKRLLFPSIERETRSNLSELAHEQSIRVFASNLEQLLLTPPLKNKVILGFDPAFRTGCKLAIINNNGDFIKKEVIYPHELRLGEGRHEGRRNLSKKVLVDLIKEYGVELIAIGNGTASRESEEFVAETIKEFNLDTKYVIVSEAGASVYSASKEAIKEFPDLHVEERSAISIARRVLDPLSELIKIDPKSIGVGQYQHDVNQTKLNETLNFVISKVVNNVGVNLNTASSELLSFVSGLNKKSAQNIIDYRSKVGLIKNRSELLKVKGIGEKSYEQAIGFLKIYESSNPLDKTFIHPENYSKVSKIVDSLDLDLNFIGSKEFSDKLSTLDISSLKEQYNLGTYTISDIIGELEKPLRDIRDEYPSPILKSNVLNLEDLSIGMKLEGTIRSIVDFGAFVDIGLKNDGLIHKSKMAKHWINHPLEVVSVGDIVDVYVIDIDLNKKRVGLSLLKS